MYLRSCAGPVCRLSGKGVGGRAAEGQVAVGWRTSGWDRCGCMAVGVVLANWLGSEKRLLVSELWLFVLGG
jgi:hypothetical protein